MKKAPVYIEDVPQEQIIRGILARFGAINAKLAALGFGDMFLYPEFDPYGIASIADACDAHRSLDAYEAELEMELGIQFDNPLSLGAHYFGAGR